MEHAELVKCLEEHGFVNIDLDNALSQVSDVELLSFVQKLIMAQEVSWDKGIPLYKKSHKLNLLLHAVVEELKARFYMRIQPKEHNIAENIQTHKKPFNAR